MTTDIPKNAQKCLILSGQKTADSFAASRLWAKHWKRLKAYGVPVEYLEYCETTILRIVKQVWISKFISPHFHGQWS